MKYIVFKYTYESFSLSYRCFHEIFKYINIFEDTLKKVDKPQFLFMSQFCGLVCMYHACSLPTPEPVPQEGLFSPPGVLDTLWGGLTHNPGLRDCFSTR